MGKFDYPWDEPTEEERPVENVNREPMTQQEKEEAFEEMFQKEWRKQHE